jgi:hypothetical protein
MATIWFSPAVQVVLSTFILLVHSLSNKFKRMGYTPSASRKLV